MLNQSLAHGWSAWHELWSARVYSLQRLREVAAHFKGPELARAFAFWARDTTDVRIGAHTAPSSPGAPDLPLP